MTGTNPLMLSRRKACNPRHDASRRVRRPGRRSRPGARHSAESRNSQPRRALPRLHLILVTPWFSAGAGIVIAAMLAVDLPHAVLSYGPYQRCTTSCLSPVQPHGSGSLASARPGVKLKPPAPRHRRQQPTHLVRAPRHPGTPPPGAVIGYQVLRQSGSGFTVVISAQVRDRSGGWTLRFEFPSAQIRGVWGARWQPSAAGNGGTASALGQPGGRQQGGQWQEPLHFVIYVAGHPQSPVGCTLNGETCTFAVGRGVGRPGGDGRGGNGRGGNGRGGNGQGGGQ